VLLYRNRIWWSDDCVSANSARVHLNLTALSMSFIRVAVNFAA